MRIQKSKILIVLSAIFLAYSCDDILEKNIENVNIYLISPQNDEEITSNVVQMQWNSIEGADSYRVQVIEENQSIVVDSIVNGNNFVCPLSKGKYQWRVRGENFGYISAYSVNWKFEVIETDDLTGQQVLLSYPDNSHYISSSTITFGWQPIAAAESYGFELINVTNGQTLVHQVAAITGNTLTLNSSVLSEDAQYQWKVKATNSVPTSTQFSARTLYVDRVNPNQPTNTLPLNEAVINQGQTLAFSWSMPSDNGIIQSPINYTLEISNQQNFETIIQSSNTSTQSFQQTLQSPGEYYWRVKAKDLSGNIGAYSSYSKYTVAQ